MRVRFAAVAATVYILQRTRGRVAFGVNPKLPSALQEAGVATIAFRTP